MTGVGAATARPRPSLVSDNGRQRLTSWKEIAAHLGVSVRTVQRWESKEGLPVRRHRHDKLSSAYAYADELDRWWDARPAGRAPNAQKETAPPSILVTPFVNLDRDEESAILCDGLTEDLITALCRLRPLRVIARSTAFRFRGEEQDIPAIRRELAVDAVLEGSLRRSGGKVRVNARLIDAADGHHLWAKRFDVGLGDAFSFEDRLTEAIAEGMRLHVLPRSNHPRASRNREAYNALLRGRHFWSNRTAESLRRALECFEEAAERDPEMAAAHAAIAESHVFLWVHGGVDWDAAVPLAEQAVARARALDPAMTGMRSASGLVRLACFDFAAGESEFRSALEENPGDHRASHWLAMALASQGRGEAQQQIEHALELDPLGATVNQDYGIILYLRGNCQEAARQLLHALEIAPASRWARAYLCFAYCLLHRTQDALNVAGQNLVLRALAEAAAGETAPAAEILRRGISPSHAWAAVLYAALDDPENALRSLAQAADSKEPDLLELCPLVQPLFGAIRPLIRMPEPAAA